LEGGPYDALTAAESDIIEHMNADHSEAIHAYAHHLADRPGVDWCMTGLDPEGCDLTRNDAVARIDFDTIVDNAQSARAELVRLAQAARDNT
jgi:putative heme iron utilization protein